MTIGRIMPLTADSDLTTRPDATGQSLRLLALTRFFEAVTVRKAPPRNKTAKTIISQRGRLGRGNDFESIPLKVKINKKATIMIVQPNMAGKLELPVQFDKS